MGKAANLEDMPMGIEEDMIVTAIDRDALVLRGDYPAAGSAAQGRLPGLVRYIKWERGRITLRLVLVFAKQGDAGQS